MTSVGLLKRDINYEDASVYQKIKLILHQSISNVIASKVYGQLIPKANLTLALTKSPDPKPDTNPNMNCRLTSSNELTWGRVDCHLPQQTFTQTDTTGKWKQYLLNETI